MLPLEALMRQARLNMRLWREKAEDWRKAVSAASGHLEGDDCFEQSSGLRQSRRIQPGQSYTWSDGGNDEVVHTLPLITLRTATTSAAPAQVG